jgi:hypothetical protein
MTTLPGFEAYFSPNSPVTTMWVSTTKKYYVIETISELSGRIVAKYKFLRTDDGRNEYYTVLEELIRAGLVII